MWQEFEEKKQVRKQVIDQQGCCMNKIFYVEQYIQETDRWKVINVIDRTTMKQCTLKLISKIDLMIKPIIVSEILTHKKLRGRDNFVELIQVYEDSTTVYLLMQKWGTPLQLVLEKRITLMERQVQLIFSQIIQILGALKMENVVHGSITLRSLLIYPKNVIKLTDFSCSKILGQGKQSKKKGNSKSINTQMSAEQNKNKNHRKDYSQYTSPQQYYEQKDAHSPPKDIWSTGVVIFKLLTGVYPFQDSQEYRFLNKIKNASFQFPTSVSSLKQNNSSQNTKFCKNFLSIEWRQLLKRMIALKHQRINLTELLYHPLRNTYKQLKLIPDILSTQPNLQQLFICKQKNNKSFQIAWKINFQQQNQSTQQQYHLYHEDKSTGQIKDKDISILHAISGPSSGEKISANLIPQQLYVKNTQQKSNKQLIDPLITLQSPKTTKKYIQQYNQESSKNLYKQNIISINKNIDNTIIKSPPLITKFRLSKNGWMGYLIDNCLGITFKDQHGIIGHNNQQFRLFSSKKSIKANHKDFLRKLNYKDKIEKSIRFHNSIDIQITDSRELNRQDHTNKEQNTNKQLNQFNFNDINIQNWILKYESYLKAINYFGQRIVKGKMLTWVMNFWKDGCINVFQLNTGIWQVGFKQGKQTKIYAVDHDGLVWSNCNLPSQISYEIRMLVKRYKNMKKK